MYLAQVACVEKLRDKRPFALQRCRGAAGLSLGDFAALTFAEVWDFETGLRAAQWRGELMETLSEQQKALAVAGLSEEKLQQLCESARGGVSRRSYYHVIYVNKEIYIIYIRIV